MHLTRVYNKAVDGEKYATIVKEIMKQATTYIKG